jgi:hypothetical protein
MKRLITLLFLQCSLSTIYAQDPESPIQKLKALESKDTTTIVPQTDSLKKGIKPKSNVDSTRIRIGRKSITIIDDDENTTFRFPNRSRHEEDWDIKHGHKPTFIGHWAGLEFGFNGFMDKNQSLSLKGNLALLDLKQARSWNINLNFMQYSIGFGNDKIGLLTGMGLEFNNYHFLNPISLKVVDGKTVIDSAYIKGNFEVSKSKLSTTHLTIPLLLEFQIPTSDHKNRIFISGGIIGGLRIGAHTKVIYDNGGRQKEKNRSDFNLSTFRYGFTARIGYKAIKLFANYYPVSLIEKDKGPEVYPFSIGLILVNFRK